MSQMIASTSGTLTSPGASVGPIGMMNANVSVLVSGTFVGTVVLQALPTRSSTTWVNIGTSLTAAGTILANNLAGDFQFRVLCSAYTSGTATVYLAACPTS